MTSHSIANISETDLIRYKCLKDLYFFTRYFHKKRNNKKWIRGRHFEIISDTLEKVYRGEITRLNINMPPRFGKTEMAVINFMGKGFALNHKAKFIHLSYSDTLALENSESTRDLITSDEFQEVFPITLKKDSKSKKKWYTSEGGGVYATSSGGQVTGFGAGITEEDDKEFDDFVSDVEKAQGFGGAIIIDDALKPDDAYSEPVREKINDRFYNTIMSRVNSPKTPIIVVGQRVHEEDLPGKLIKEGGWHTLSLPAIDKGEHLWEYRRELVEEIKAKKPYIFYTQYQQEPQNKPNENPFFYAYSKEKFYLQEKAKLFNNQYLYLSFDFNKNPCTLVIGQRDSFTAKSQILETLEADVNTVPNKTPLKALCHLFKKKYLDSGLITKNKVIITGDASGRAGNANQMTAFGFYTVISEELGIKISGKSFKVPAKNPSHELSEEICNNFLNTYAKGEFINHDEDLNNEIIMTYKPLKKAKDELGLHKLDGFRYLLHLWCDYENHVTEMKRTAVRLKNNS